MSMLKSKQGVQECDATEANGKFNRWLPNLPNLYLLIRKENGRDQKSFGLF
jgi:hypothetical protein